jgi:probable DNA repair protein
MTAANQGLPVEIVGREPLFERIAQGEILVTGNSRLSRGLTDRYSQWRVARGDRCWLTPRIFSWDAWVGRLWESAAIDGIEGATDSVLGPRQLLSLWERVLRDDPGSAALLRPESLAAHLRDTRRLVVDWRIDPDDGAWLSEDTENCAAFRRWNRAFESVCRKRGWMPPEDRTAPLSEAIRGGVLAVEKAVGFLGFDEFSPAQRKMLDALQKSGCTVSRLAFRPAGTAAAVWRSPGCREELRQMARWVRHWLEQDPAASIGIVVPDLQARRTEIERHLQEVLLPAAGGPAATARPWNLSLGMPLSRLPMIEAAFDLLGLLDRRIDVRLVGRVLRSPWIEGGMSERNSRALLEKCLRDHYPRHLKRAEVRYRAGEIKTKERNGEALPPELHEPRPWNSPLMGRLMEVLEAFERESRGKRRPSDWAQAIDGLLARLGWPQQPDAEAGERAANWQAGQAWQEALSELASLDLTDPGLDRATAVSRLRQICGERVFQARSPPAAIQVLGLYEASGLQFDHLWVLGLHNDNWPPTARPNPFIPGRLQQAAGLPHSSPARELEVARTVTRRLLESAGDCIFSYPGQVEGEEVLPSPLFRGECFRPMPADPASAGCRWLDVVKEAPGPRTVPLEMPGPLSGETARGGSSILRNQALCPFRAFASNRLGAESLETPMEGISPTLHGSLLHRVLEGFWRETQTHEALMQLGQHELTDRIAGHVEQVMAQERSVRDRPEFSGAEGRRLARLAAAHLELEKSRLPFEVTGFEQEVHQEIEGQVIRLYIDRIDRLATGQRAIIDYKSGKVDPKKWFGDRPEDPQLPLYAISAGETPDAIVFTVIRDERCGYQGVAAAEGIFPGLPPRASKANEDLIRAGQEMPETIRKWRRTLHRLMADFLSGEAAIDPKEGERTCNNTYCELHALCRVGEIRHLKAEEGL